MKKETAEHLLELSEQEYDAYAPEFSRSRRFFWKELEFLKEYVHMGETVLDIGCGNGRLVDVWEGIDVSYIGIDSSKELIEIAKKERGDRGVFLHGNALALPFEHASFDAVFSIAVLHHIPSVEHRMRFVSEVYRVLKPGGTCVLTVWDTLQWKFITPHVLHGVKKLFGFSTMDFGDIIIPFGKEKRKRYIHTFTKSGLQTLFEEASFTDMVIKEIVRKSGYANLVVVAKKKHGKK